MNIGFKKIKIKDMFSGILKFECLEKHCNIKAFLVNMNINEVQTRNLHRKKTGNKKQKHT